MILPCIFAKNIHLNDISPEEAQQFFTDQSLDLAYAKKLIETPLSDLRSENQRKYYINGRLIDNPEDYVVETYKAKQFHGQDGLGRAMFGYRDHNQARLEARNADGDVRGSYQYIDPNNENIIVQYWSDALGFHQTDNRPKVVLEAVTDTPEVQAARLEHERLWQEAARLAKVNPDPYSDDYNRAALAYDNQVEAEELEKAVSASNQAQGLTRYPNLYDKKSFDGQTIDDSDVVESESQFVEKRVTPRSRDDKEPVEIPSVPRGFFYKFQYPVHLITEIESKRALKGNPEGASKHRRPAVGQTRDVYVEKTVTPVEAPSVRTAQRVVVYDPQVETKATNVRWIGSSVSRDSRAAFGVESPAPGNTKTIETSKSVSESPAVKTLTLETSDVADADSGAAVETDIKPEFARISLKAVQEGGIPIDAVHDAQVHPKQRANLVNSQKLPVVLHSD